MLNTNEVIEQVVSVKVDEKRRSEVLPNYFKSYLFTENHVYQALSNLCQSYNGGYWEFFELSNGGFYMAPRVDEKMLIEVNGNYFSEQLSASASGIVVCLMTYSMLSFHDRSGQFSRLFQFLREYALDHEEAGLIFKAID